VVLLALGQADLQLGQALLVPIELERNQGAAVALNGADQLVDLLAMQQQLPVPARLVVEAVGVAVGRDVGVDQLDLRPSTEA
jgi:hypothetical protein